MGNQGCFSPGKASCNRGALPNLRCMLGVWCFHNDRIVNVHAGVNACILHSGVYGHRKRVSTESRH